MKQRPWTARAQALLLLGAALVVLLLSIGAGTVWADEGDEPEKPAATEGTEKGELKVDALETQLMEHPAAAWALILGRFLPIVIGIVLLILWFLKQDKIRGGVLPRPPPAEPTLPVSVFWAALLLVLAVFFGPAVVMVALSGRPPSAASPTWLIVVGVGVPTLAVAAFLLRQRRRVQRESPQEVQTRFGPDAPVPTQPPRMKRAFGLGLWGWCVAGVVVVPAALVWTLILQHFGAEPMAQDTVRRVLEDPSPVGPILIAILAIFVAPLTEECLFRGMLYPAVKHSLGGGKRGGWIGALLVSAIFAAVHNSLYAAVPLFVLALVLNWVFETTNSLAAAIFIHALHNGMTMIPLLILRFVP